MSDIGNDPTSVLHIGWWRNGYHAYDRAVEQAVTPVAGKQSGPTDREIRKEGAILAATICLTWISIGVIGSVVLAVVSSGFVAVPALIAVAGTVALPVFTWLGWRYAHAAKTRKAFLPMTILGVLLTDLEIVLSLLMVGLVAFVLDWLSVGHSTMAADGLWLVPKALAAAALLYAFGLLIFGLPGLLLAIPSAWFWEHDMRRTFNWRDPEVGARESGDRPRS